MKELLSYKRGIQAHFEQEAPFLLSSTRNCPARRAARQCGDNRHTHLERQDRRPTQRLRAHRLIVMC